jgi:hypothetical protein
MTPDEIQAGKCYLSKMERKPVVVKVVAIAAGEIRISETTGRRPVASNAGAPRSGGMRLVKWTWRHLVPPSRTWSAPQITRIGQFAKLMEKEVDCNLQPTIQPLSKPTKGSRR